MGNHFIQKKKRLSTKEKFLLSRRYGTTSEDKPLPWFRRRGNYLVLLVIFIFVLLTFVVAAFLSVHQSDMNSPANGTEMERNATPTPLEADEDIDYEEAKRIFRGIQSIQ
ncbi:MAG: hypothetical protein C4527_05630 [Candidatus Omnitrophota bacterium]|jgi:hypothetical protein|nr:MAG: hypothetical protein C4527_05630 [Candidatus Omnitrophota bacterium]